MRNGYKIILSLIVLWSVICGISLLVSGRDLTGATNDVLWGLLIAGYTFFVSSIGACFVGSLGSVFRIKKYEAIEKKAILLAIIIVLVGMAVIFVELGRPFRMFLNYIIHPNFTSPIWWMGVNYTAYLVFVIWEFVLLMKNKSRQAQIVGIFGFLSAVAAHSTVGSVFGVNQTRSFWYGPYMPIDFILCAWILGFAITIFVLWFAEKTEESKSLTIDMGKWLAALLAINLFFIFWKVITGLYSTEKEKYLATLSLIKGPLSVRFWLIEIIVGIILPFLMLVLTKWRSVNVVYGASVLATIGMFVNKMNMVEAGQIIPLEIKREAIVTYLKYTPTFTEVSIVAGAIAFILLFYSLVEKFYFAKIKEV